MIRRSTESHHAGSNSNELGTHCYILALFLYSFPGIHFWTLLATGYWARQTSGLIQHGCSFHRQLEEEISCKKYVPTYINIYTSSCFFFKYLLKPAWCILGCVKSPLIMILRLLRGCWDKDTKDDQPHLQETVSNAKSLLLHWKKAFQEIIPENPGKHSGSILTLHALLRDGQAWWFMWGSCCMILM